MSQSDTWELPEPFPETADEAADAFPERGTEILEKFADGGFIVSFRYSGRKFEPLNGGLYYVPPGVGESPDHEVWEEWWEVKGRYQNNERERRAIILGRLNERTGFWWEATPEGGSVPLSVALDGQKAIAAYLFAWQNLTPEGIAAKMEKSIQTVRQYLSDYKAGRTG